MIKTLKIDQGVFVTLLGSAANVLLVVVKFIAGTLGKSTALIADAFHSLSDLMNDGVVIFTYKIGRIPKDEGHPYGHGRAETIGSTVIGTAILLVGLRLAFDIWEKLAAGVTTTPDWITAVVAALSIACKESLYRYTKRTGEKLKSPAIIANAWDQRSDAVSSAATLLGIVGAKNGFPILDPLAGGVVALLIAAAGISVLRKGLRDLMDSALDEQKIHDIERIARSVPGVVQLHDLRTRRIGGEILIDLHVLVEPKISVTEGHNIAERVRRELIKSLGNVQDALVHVDPEDDSAMETLYNASREELERLTGPIIASMEGVVANGSKMRVHYLNGKNVIEIFVRVDENKTVEEARQISQKLRSRLKELEPVDDVQIYLDVDRD